MGAYSHAPVRYWDSCTFLAYLKDECEADDCEAVLDAARSGDTKIVTSALTLAEVVRAKGLPSLPSEMQAEIEACFSHSFVAVRSVTRRTAEFARMLVWDHAVTPKDAIHVATAFESRCKLLETKDDKLLGLNPLSVSGYGQMEIAKPLWPEPRLVFGSGAD